MQFAWITSDLTQYQNSCCISTIKSLKQKYKLQSYETASRQNIESPWRWNRVGLHPECKQIPPAKIYTRFNGAEKNFHLPIHLLQYCLTVTLSSSPTLSSPSPSMWYPSDQLVFMSELLVQHDIFVKVNATSYSTLFILYKDKSFRAGS